jgi:GAF domain-containing protein
LHPLRTGSHPVHPRGLCAAAREDRTQIVADVDAFPGHIACAASTRSEIVVPVLDAQDRLIAVRDADSDSPGAFDAADAEALEAMVAEIFARAAPRGLRGAVLGSH